MAAWIMSWTLQKASTSITCRDSLDMESGPSKPSLERGLLHEVDYKPPTAPGNPLAHAQVQDVPTTGNTMHKSEAHLDLTGNWR